MTPAGKAWLVLIGAVVTYEALCIEGELLSEGVDRALLKAPVLTHAAVIITGLHLLNVYDRASLTHLDPYSYLPRLFGKGMASKTRTLVR